jgi:hypothetical protein
MSRIGEILAEIITKPGSRNIHILFIVRTQIKKYIFCVCDDFVYTPMHVHA